MRTGKNQKKLLALAISLALAGSVGYASPDNTVTVENQPNGQKEVTIASDGLQHNDNSTINAKYDDNSGSATYEITAINFGNVSNYSLSVAAGNITAQRASGSGSGDIVFNGLRWEGGTGNALTLKGGAYTATAGVGSAASLDRVTLQKYSGTLTINDMLDSNAKGGSGNDSQMGGSATVKGLTIVNGSTVTINGTTSSINSIATGGDGKDDKNSDYGNGGSATATSVTLNSSNISGTLSDITATATGGKAGSNTNSSTPPASATTARGDGGEATATSLIVNNSQTAETFTTATITATATGGSGGSIKNDLHSLTGNGGAAAATGVQVTDGSIFTQKGDTEINVKAVGGAAAATNGKGGNAEATGVSVTGSGLTHTYETLIIEATGGNGTGNDTSSGSGAATANGLVLTNATTKGSISGALGALAIAGDNAALTDVALIGSAKATGLQISGGTAEESINWIDATSSAGQTSNQVGAAESTGVLVKETGKLQLTMTNIDSIANASYGDNTVSNTSGGVATATAIRGETDTVVEVIGGPNGLMINAFAAAKAHNNGTALATAISGTSNEMSFKTANQAIVVTATTDLDSATVSDTAKNHAMAVNANHVKLTFDSGTAMTTFTGDVSAVNGSTVHFYAGGNTLITNSNGSSGHLDLSGSTVDTTGHIATQNGTLTLNGSTLYLYKNDGKALYDTATADYHMVAAKQLADAGTDAKTNLYLRTNSQLDSNAGTGDKLALATQNANDRTAYTLHVFDAGMKTGYQANEAYATQQVLIEKASANATYTAADDIAYDNGVWNYTYTPEVGMNSSSGNLELTKVTTKSVAAGAANLTAADAHAASAASNIAFTRKKLDTLGQRFGALRQGTEAENGFWVKYLGGRLDVSLHRDADIDYNGVQVGYDRRAGNGWTVGFAGSYLKGDADYAYGSGDIKDTSFALYGTQQRADGSYLDLVGQFGKSKNDVTAYGGSVAQRIDSDFDSNVYALSAKYGKRQTKENGSYVEPSFQLVYSNLGSESYSARTLNNVMRVDNDATDSLLLRTGVELGQKFGKKTNAYLRAALQYEFLGDVKTRVTADNRSAFYDESFDGFSLAWGVGIDHQMNETSSLHLDLGRVEGGDLKESWAVNAMCRVFF